MPPRIHASSRAAVAARGSMPPSSRLASRRSQMGIPGTPATEWPAYAGLDWNGGIDWLTAGDCLRYLDGMAGSALLCSIAPWAHRKKKPTHWGHPVIVKDGVHHRCLLASPRTAHADKEKQKSNVQGQHEVH
jgi:hypothetical protein